MFDDDNLYFVLQTIWFLLGTVFVFLLPNRKSSFNATADDDEDDDKKTAQKKLVYSLSLHFCRFLALAWIFLVLYFASFERQSLFATDSVIGIVYLGFEL